MGASLLSGLSFTTKQSSYHVSKKVTKIATIWAPREPDNCTSSLIFSEKRLGTAYQGKGVE